MTGNGRSELTDRLADYLNGHLDPQAKAEMERALAQDEALQEQLQFETNLQQALRAEAREREQMAAAATSGFDAIAERLDKPGWLRGIDWGSHIAWARLGVPAFALAIAVLAFTNPGPGESGIPVNEFQTLSDPSVPGSAATAQLLLRSIDDRSEVERLLAAHGLVTDPSRSTGKVLWLMPASGEAQVDALVSRLPTHDAILFVKVTGTE